MSDDNTTGSDASGSAEPTIDSYVQKYNGLQSAFQRKVNEWTRQEQAWQSERSEYEAKLAKLAEYEARDAEAAEEATLEAEFERLRERFDPEPTPLRHNESRSSGPREPKRDHTAPWPT
jgi:hypothetical protein